MNHVSKRVSVSVSVYQVKVKRCHEQFVRCIDKKLVSIECHFISFSRASRKFEEFCAFLIANVGIHTERKNWLCATTTRKVENRSIHVDVSGEIKLLSRYDVNINLFNQKRSFLRKGILISLRLNWANLLIGIF